MSITTNWEEEIELIDNLGLLYPVISGWPEYDKNWTHRTKARWIYYLCKYKLNQHFPQLEHFLCSCLDKCWWDHYKEHFNIK